MIEWWNPPKPTVCIPINAFGPNDGYQFSHPKEWDFPGVEDANVLMQEIGWLWFWPKHEGWAWRMVWNEKAIGPLEAC